MKRTSGIVVLVAMAGVAAAIFALRDVIVRGLLARGVGLSVLDPAAEMPPLPDFPYESMEPTVRTQFLAAARRAQADPLDADAGGELGDLFLAYGFHGLAAPCYQRAAMLAPEAWWWRYRFGVALFERGEWEQAMAEFDRVLVQRPDRVGALLHRAEASRRLNLGDRALAGYRRVIELAPEHARAWGGIGQIQLRQGSLDAAASSLAEALRLSPGYGPARYAMGRVLRSQGRLDDARATLKIAEQQREMEPPLDPVLSGEFAALRTGAIDALHRAIELARAGALDQAIALFAEAIRIDPGLAETHSQLGAARLAAGDDAAALPHLLRALELDPAFADARYNLGLLAHRGGRFDEAVTQFEMAVTIRPDHYDAHLGLGTDLPRVGRDAEAIEHLRRATTLRPNQARPCKRLAAALSAGSMFDDAVAVLRTGVRRLPGDASIADRLAWLLATCPDAAIRDPEAALQLAEAVCRRTTDREPQALVTLAAALGSLGRYTEAVEVATRARELARSGGRTQLAAEIALQLGAYRAGRAWIAPAPTEPVGKSPRPDVQ
ncbi:MAG: tetratricopeptide repeat protein [Phycisphaerales bacterium]